MDVARQHETFGADIAVLIKQKHRIVRRFDYFVEAGQKLGNRRFALPLLPSCLSGNSSDLGSLADCGPELLHHAAMKLHESGDPASVLMLRVLGGLEHDLIDHDHWQLKREQKVKPVSLGK